MARQAKQLIDQGRFVQAIQLLEQHLARAGGDNVARNLLAFAHFQSGSYGKAEALYRGLVAVAHPDPRNLYNLGRTLEVQGKLEEAMLWIGAAASADPGFSQAVAHRDRLAGIHSAPHTGSGPPSSIQRPPQQPTATAMMTQLGIPGTDEELRVYAERLAARSRQEWWIQKWSGLPLGVRLFKLVIWLIVFIGVTAIFIIVIGGWFGLVSL